MSDRDLLGIMISIVALFVLFLIVAYKGSDDD